MDINGPNFKRILKENPLEFKDFSLLGKKVKVNSLQNEVSYGKSVGIVSRKIITAYMDASPPGDNNLFFILETGVEEYKIIPISSIADVVEESKKRKWVLILAPR